MLRLLCHAFAGSVLCGLLALTGGLPQGAQAQEVMLADGMADLRFTLRGQEIVIARNEQAWAGDHAEQTETALKQSERRTNVAGKNEHWNASHLLRPRTAIYFTVWAAVGIAMLVTLINRSQLDVNVVPDRNPLFVQLSDGAIRNGYTVKILNQKQELRTFRLLIDGLKGATMEMVGEEGAPREVVEIAVEPDKLKAVKIYVSTADHDVLKHGKSEFTFRVEELNVTGEPETAMEQTVFHAPDNDEED